jgi:hypothetical protein
VMLALKYAEIEKNVSFSGKPEKHLERRSN